jgi:hypothetical protein
MNPEPTSPAAPPARRRPRVRRIPLRWAFSRAVVASLVAATLLIAGLSLQMSLGSDPGLGPKLAAQRSGSGSTQTAAATPTPASSGSPATAVPPPAPVQTSTS